MPRVLRCAHCGRPAFRFSPFRVCCGARRSEIRGHMASQALSYRALQAAVPPLQSSFTIHNHQPWAERPAFLELATSMCITRSCRLGRGMRRAGRAAPCARSCGGAGAEESPAALPGMWHAHLVWHATLTPDCSSKQEQRVRHTRVTVACRRQAPRLRPHSRLRQRARRRACPAAAAAARRLPRLAALPGAGHEVEAGASGHERPLTRWPRLARARCAAACGRVAAKGGGRGRSVCTGEAPFPVPCWDHQIWCAGARAPPRRCRRRACRADTLCTRPCPAPTALPTRAPEGRPVLQPALAQLLVQLHRVARHGGCSGEGHEIGRGRAAGQAEGVRGIKSDEKLRPRRPSNPRGAAPGARPATVLRATALPTHR